MASKHKKVLLFIVEGPSDEAALGSVIKEYFSSMEVSFYVVHGDIMTRTGITSGNIIKEIHHFIKTTKEKYRYKDSDILQIVHLVDTDGVFIEENRIKETPTQHPLHYFTDHIETSSFPSTSQRNLEKSELLTKLSRTGKIGSIPYQIYYMSCNLEHLLFDQLRQFSNQEKWQLADDFADQYEGRPNAFLTFLSTPSLTAPGTYQETWNFIREGVNSLNRYSNFSLFFLNETQAGRH